MGEETLKILRSIVHLKFVARDDKYITCYVNNLIEAQNAVDIFRRKSSTSYFCCRKPKDFGNRPLPPKVIVAWCDDETHTSSKSTNVQIIPDQGIPFVIYPGVWTLECNFGPDNNAWGKKKWKEEQMKRLNVDHPQGKSVKRVKTYDCRRLGCPAKIQMKEAFIVNGYAVASNGIDKLAIQRSIMDQVLLTGSVSMTRRIYMRFPDKSIHEKHQISDYSCLLNPVDPRIVTLVRRSLEKGITRRSDLNGVIALHNEDNFPEVKITDAAFYPSMSTLSSIMYRQLLHLRYSHMDEERILEITRDYIKENPNDLMYFRPKNKEANVDDMTYACTDDDDIMFHVPMTYEKHDTSTLLWIHQSSLQLYLLRRYNNLVLMDATYKTCKMALPLFFLVVKTNVGYSVVGEFIIQQEDTDSIAEALGVFQAHWLQNHVQVKSFMVDKSPAEHAALRAVFPCAEVYLCDFHRLQCWDRFLRTGKNGLTQHRDETFKMLRNIGEACTEEDYDNAYEVLVQSYVWNKDSVLRDYIHREWTGNEAMWVYRFRIGKQLYDHTNNGVESKNKMFKYNFLNCCRNLLMSKLVVLITKVFVPMQITKYTADNARTNPCVADTMVDTVPDFLRSRPKWFIKHCLEQMTKAKEWEDCELYEEGVFLFKIRSSSSDKFYEVDIDAYNPRCTCYAWLKSELPCKHIFAVLAHTYVSWYDLPESFRNHPLFSLDNDILQICDPTFVPSRLDRDFDKEVLSEMEKLLDPPSVDNDHEMAESLDTDSKVVDTHLSSEDSIDTLCFKIREQCTLISTVSYNATDVQGTKETLETLSAVYRYFHLQCENDSGLVQLKTGDLVFRTNRNRKPKRAGMFGKRRITPLYNTKKTMKKNRPYKSKTVTEPLASIIGELPPTKSEMDPKDELFKMETNGPRVNAPSLPSVDDVSDDEITDVTLEYFLTKAEDVFVDKDVKKSLECDGGSFTPFADINAYKSSIQVRIPDRVQKMKPTEVKCMKDISEWNKKIVASDLDKFRNSNQFHNRILTSSIYYVVAKIGPFVLKDVDLLPLQGQHWQTDQLMSAYLYLLAKRRTTAKFSIKYLDYDILGKILRGNIGDTNNDGVVTKLHLTTKSHNDIATSSCMIGTYHQNGNHWTLVLVDLRNATFVFIDPLQVREMTVCKNLMKNFCKWTVAYNVVKPAANLPTAFKPRVIPHQKQQDGTNCGIWTLWFAKQILSGKQVMQADVALEGAHIAADIMTSSDSISSICAKCGLNLFVDNPALKMCNGNCRPRRTFHATCLPEENRKTIKFYCQVCDPSTREEFCFKCSCRPDGNMAYCKNGDYTGCTNFVHVRCLQAGSDEYRCGLCTLRLT